MNTMNTTLFKQKYLEGDGKLDSTVNTDKKAMDAVQEEQEKDRNSDIQSETSESMSSSSEEDNDLLVQIETQ